MNVKEELPDVLVERKKWKVLKQRDGKILSKSKEQIDLGEIVSGAWMKGQTPHKTKFRYDKKEKAINVSLHTEDEVGKLSKPIYTQKKPLSTLYGVRHSNPVESNKKSVIGKVEKLKDKYLKGIKKSSGEK